MQYLEKALLVAHTLRHLRPIQVWGQLRNRFPRKKPAQSGDAQVSVPVGEWCDGIVKHHAYLGDWTFRFLNEESKVSPEVSWWSQSRGNLWNYNLSYFEWLNQEGTRVSPDEAKLILNQWIEMNPAGSTRAWDPYPVSLRIINWIRFFIENEAVESVHDSLAYHARWLSGRIETHLLGNHYLVNGVALLFAGLYFEGKEAERWLRLGWSIVREELPTEVLDDGGHFERSPMYHSLILEDVLNLLNLAKTYTRRSPQGLESLCSEVAVSMLTWLRQMTYCDGTFPLFNDAANGIAASLADLDAYALRLSLDAQSDEIGKGVRLLKQSGFGRIEAGKAVVFTEVGGPDPSYQPGHAHAGTLGFELMVAGEKVLVDTGTNTYEVSAERARQRSTHSHNTLIVNGKNSSETWSSFRVGRRAVGKCLSYEQDVDAYEQTMVAEHDGYERTGCGGLHRRVWKLSDEVLQVSDSINEMKEGASVEIRFHFSPNTRLRQDEGSWVGSCGALSIRVSQHDDFSYSLESYDYCPEFGRSLNAQCLVARISATSVNVTHTLQWSLN
ncbi:MAG: alginate lyase family protein [Opitutae bacterium]|nr:alginate lyase family protein [Opitutae bacterium]